MSLIEATPAGYFQEIIKLQLKKPKNWNWQLSTSKSSPHISLPIIQLYDSKGQLVVEAKDTGATQRRSWHSSNVHLKETTTTNIKRGYKEPTDRHLQRCRSDTLERKNCSANKLDPIKTRETQRSTNNKLTKSSSAVLDSSILTKTADVSNENRKSRSYNENPIKVEGVKHTRNLHDLQKSTSDVLELKGNSRLVESLKRNPLRPIGSVVDIPENKEKNSLHRHRRARSDDLFRRKLKYSEQSLKRAETDGYKNFMVPHDNPAEPAEKSGAVVTTAENVLSLNNGSNIEVNHFKHNRYKTRTSSAGTLIISEESFNNCHRRRRRRDASIENSNNAQNNAGPFREDGEARKKGNRGFTAGLFNSRSDIFPFEKTLNKEVNKKHDDNRNYIVQEPVTPSSDNKSRKNSEAIIEKLERKKRTKVRRRCSDASTSSTTREKKHQHKRKGNGTKGRGNWSSISAARDY
ncbi:peptidyl-prolyl cis-trans isomerase G [Asbolus verrucosus]|uniref:Peptidyl-prolyl cis-trans isomerase G n=1 Tax=Asbolus verrucosus TaxID=1661398 RepID=A0A482VYA1_ASBVE|nr:peptidyl-prolyl cis-trans isomerase G [Asbolus verrucosus]